MSAFLLSLLLSLSANTFAGKSAPKPAVMPVQKAAAAAAPLPGLCIFGGQSGKPFGDAASFKSVIWKSDVIYAGAPGQAKDQQTRLEILRALREARSSKIAVGFEVLDVSKQSVLDDYAAGKITEAEFLQASGWLRESAADFALYKPVFDFIVRYKLRALALGVPKAVTFKIEREGPSALTSAEKKDLPAQAAVGKNKKYLEFLKTSFAPNGAAAASGALSWENYLAAASYWNEAAGARIADFVNANPGWTVLVASGNDRFIYNAALPASVKSRTVKVRQASFYVEDAACPQALPADHKDLANYVWYVTQPIPLPSISTSATPAPAASPGKKI